MRVEAAALDRVGENARMIYLMFVHGGSSVKEIAQGMMLSERTVENHIFRTRSNVRDALRKAI
jgi:DNA-directed RNA polymerase specialized sigma24 family protein